MFKGKSIIKLYFSCNENNFTNVTSEESRDHQFESKNLFLLVDGDRFYYNHSIHYLARILVRREYSGTHHTQSHTLPFTLSLTQTRWNSYCFTLLLSSYSKSLSITLSLSFILVDLFFYSNFHSLSHTHTHIRTHESKRWEGQYHLFVLWPFIL